MNDEDEYIPSWNGQTSTPQDKLAKGCGWLLAWIVIAVVGVGLAQLAEAWWRAP